MLAARQSSPRVPLCAREPWKSVCSQTRLSSSPGCYAGRCSALCGSRDVHHRPLKSQCENGGAEPSTRGRGKGKCHWRDAGTLV